jgi:hypothetical protein
MMNGNEACNIPESLFEDDEDETKVTRSSTKKKKEPSTTKDASPEFQALIEKTSEKISRRKHRSKTIAAATFDRALADVDEMIKTGEWEGAGARHLVALYDRLHLKCYGIEATDLGSAERYNAAMMAANLVKREFGGEVAEAAEFMRHIWEREISAEKWRRENNRINARRIGFRLMFSGGMVADYRLYLARRSHNT